MVTSGWPQATQSPLLAGTRRSMTGIPDVSLLPPTDRSEGPRAIMHLKTLCLVFKNPSLKATGKLRFFFFLVWAALSPCLAFLFCCKDYCQEFGFMGLPWWSSGLESTCQCRGHGFNPWSRKIPHATEQLSPHALGPVSWNQRSHQNEKPTHQN